LARLEDLAKDVPAGPAPDVAALTEGFRSASEGHAEADARFRAQAGELGRFREQRQRVGELLELIEASQRESENLRAFADELSGINPARIRFSSWVLAWWLERVLERASSRLEHLSGGRYRFVRHAEVGDLRSKVGLEIDFHDAYANGQRSVLTLSGGEKFLAALSLALGMAEVIQSRSGGIDLDALFIDEGFGSLDSETLEKAMRVLDELGQGRMVGLISHVEGMKHIPCQVQVIKTETGSRVQVVGATGRGREETA